MSAPDDPKKNFHKGRGAGSNPTGRFEKLTLGERFDEALPPGEEEPSPRTQFLKDHSRTVVSQNDSPDVPMSSTLNPYRGCEHGCIYCYARPTHEYFGMSAGVDFETKILVKEDAPELLEQKLRSRSWKPEPITLSGVTDPYQPVERRLKITRRCLEVLTRFRNPFSTISKNHLVTRDIDLFAEMAQFGAAAAFISVTSLDPKITTILEPRTSRPAFRLDAIKQLSRAGVPVGVMMAPVIPGITDHEMPSILEAAADAGARFAGFVPVRLPHGVAPLFEEWLGNHFPDRKDKVLNLIRSIRGGELNDPNFGSRMRGSGPYADQIRTMFHLYCKKLGLNQDALKLSTDHFIVPPKPGDQMTLW